jgi:Outer membrane lipoprotein-sorting protein
MRNAFDHHHFTTPGKVLVLLSILHAAACAYAGEMSGREIMEEVSRHHESEVEMETLAMTLTDRKGRVAQRNLRQYSRRNADGFFKYLLVFDKPKGVKGVALLTWEKEGGDDYQWLYLPALGNRLKRIASGGRMNYFMGTDFAFEDLVTEQHDNFSYERQADQLLSGQDVFVIDARPNDPKIVTGYKKRQLFIRKDIFAVVRVDFFQRRTGKQLKRLTVNKLVQVEGDQWRATERLMDNFSKNHKTQITSLERSFATEDVPDSVFAHRFITSKSHMR